MEEINQIKNIVLYHKSEKCFKCGNLVEKNSEGYFKCECGFEWANMFIKRIPVDAFKIFKDYADREFCSDYGMAIKSMTEDTTKWATISVIISELEQRISKLEEKPVKEIKLLSGNKLEVKRSGSI